MMTSECLEPLTLRQTKSLLATIGQSPQRKWGQNFLIDPNIVHKSIELSQLVPGENVVEIGPGLGTLTRAILKNGGHVFAIEYDTKLHTFLGDMFVDVPHFQIICGDAVERPLAGFSQSEPFKIIANLPYHIATPWIDAVLEQPQLPISMTLMLQHEAALRLLAEPGSKKFSAVSIFLTSSYHHITTFPVARTSFFPAPNVDSVIIHLRRQPNPKIFCPQIKMLIRQLFTQRRKQIGRLIKSFAPEIFNSVEQLLFNHDFALSVRPEQLPLLFWNDFDELLETINHWGE